MMSLAGLGRPSLIVALGFSVIALALCASGAITRRRDLTRAGVRAVSGSAFFTLVAALALVSAFFAHDFSNAYVAGHSSSSLMGPYLISALWSGMEGSLLLWALLLTCFSTLALHQARKKSPRLVAGAGAVLAGVAVFFLALLVIPANPFLGSNPVPADGTGLNPFLQSPGMLIHPPLLYTGFVGFSIPFAFAMAALFNGRLDDAWFISTRRWTLFAWSALSIGIVLGGAWAYTELGWGGYWAWDPVENASFLPWLTATAFLHSVVIQEKRRMLKVWNVSLILLTYALAIFGTFLTRSGILSSIHTFSEGPIGKWFLPFLGFILIGGLAVIAWRMDALKSENRFDSLLSRESAFLVNNVLFVAAAFAVLWGTIYPILAELFTGVRLSIGPPFFNSVFVPIAIAIILMTGIGPLISWRRMSKGAFVRIVRLPLAAGAVTALVLGLLGVRSIGALLAYALCAFTAVAIGGEFARGSRIYRTRERIGLGAALVRTLMRNRRRYGGYVVHLGVLLIVIWIAGAAFRVERQRVLDPGQTMQVGNYTLEYAERTTATTAEKQVTTARIEVTRGGSHVTTLFPQRNFHFAQQQPQSEVAIRSTPSEDLYVVVTSFDQDGSAAVRAFVNPLIWWIWVGATVMLLGMCVLLSSSSPVAAAAPARPPAREPAVALR
jgi:cytochrome c-type biogenesis protein CcmF